MDNSYKDVRDDSVFVKFKLTADSSKELLAKLEKSELVAKDIYVIAWTTTPWTLPANSALAVNAEFDYQLVEVDGQLVVIADILSDSILGEASRQEITKFKGDQLVGLGYQPLFEDHGRQGHKIWSAGYVSAEEGSGIVHLAPAYGEEDYQLAIDNHIPVVRKVDDHGLYTSGQWQGQSIWQVGSQIIDTLKQTGSILKIEVINHSYPHCHRCQTRLMYKVHASWFLDIADQKQAMLDHNKAIYWFPKHIKNNRFKDTIVSAPDWNISRDRMWATPLPVWRGYDDKAQTDKTIVVGSFKELEELSGVTLEDYHRPWVDEIEFELEGVSYRRVDKVLDCWFESGSMPFAQYHYPFENKDLFESSFPADFIAEYVGQVRAWFYYLHAIGVGLFNKPAFSNVIVTGTLLGDDGRKMSKSLGNYTDPLELLEAYSADAYRLVLMSSPVLTAEDFIMTTKEIADKQRKLDTLRSALEFFLLYASADSWQLEVEKHKQMPVQGGNILDDWILQRLVAVNRQVTEAFNNYDLPNACRPIIELIDDLSNWYIRRNRKRFWKSDNDDDKQQAYHCLYFVLNGVAHLIAPICPFLAEEIYQKINQTRNSIHLSDWLVYSLVDKPADLTSPMRQIRNYITQGLALRAESGMKVRQPLAKITIADSGLDQLGGAFRQIIAEELNVKMVEVKDSSELAISLDTVLTDDLRHEGLARELVRCIQTLRRQFDLEVENRISLSIKVDHPQMQLAIEQFRDYITEEVLATSFEFGTEVTVFDYKKDYQLEDVNLLISLQVTG